MIKREELGGLLATYTTVRQIQLGYLCKIEPENC